MKKTQRMLALVLVLALAVSALFALAACQTPCEKDGHKYEEGVCTVCGEKDPDYVEHVHEYGVDGYCSCGLVDEKAYYTRNLTMSLSPATWNPFTYQSANDSVVLDYTTDGFYAFDYKDINDPAAGYEVIPSMASKDPIDVTSQYVGKYEIEEGETGKAFRITLKEGLKFEDGTPITAQTYVESFRRLLDPTMANYRAPNYYTSSPAIVGAEAYAKGGVKKWFQADQYFGKVYDASKDSEVIFSMGSKEGTAGRAQATLRTKYQTGYETTIGLTSSQSAGEYLTLLASVGFGAPIEGVDAAAIDALEGKTFAEIKADATLKATFDAICAWWDDGEVGMYQFSVYYGELPKQDFDTTVGVIAVSDTELDIIYNAEIVGFYIKITVGLPLVNIAKYDASISTDATTGLKTSNYGTSVETYVGCSYGPYKLTKFADGQVLEFERNENYFAYDEKYAEEYGSFEIDGKTYRQYQTDKIVITQVKDRKTSELKFLAGEIDSFGLNAEYLKEYGGNPDLIYTEGYSTFYGIINSNYDALRAREIVMNGDDESSKKYNNTILSIKEFRQALSYAIDREELCRLLYPAGSAAFGLYSNGIMADPTNAKTYREFDEAKEALVRVWGLEYGADKTFKTLDEAYKAIKGYDLAQAKELVDIAVDKAIQLGYMDENSIVRIYHNESDDSDTAKLWHATFKEWFDKMVEGTKLEGKFEYLLDTSLGTKFGEAIRSGVADCAWGFGWTGSALDPWGLCEVYLDASYNPDGYQYDPYNNFAVLYPEVTINVDFGDGAKDHTYNITDWWAISVGISKSPISGEALPNGAYAKISDVDRAEILAKIEECVLLQYTTIPIMNEGSVQLNSYKIRYYDTENYIYGVGYGGIRYTTYYYTDAAWTAFVAEQGGTLNYK